MSEVFKPRDETHTFKTRLIEKNMRLKLLIETYSLALCK